MTSLWRLSLIFSDIFMAYSHAVLSAISSTPLVLCASLHLRLFGLTCFNFLLFFSKGAESGFSHLEKKTCLKTISHSRLPGPRTKMLFHMSQREKKGEGDGKYMSVFHTRKLFANQPVSNHRVKRGTIISINIWTVHWSVAKCNYPRTLGTVLGLIRLFKVVG